MRTDLVYLAFALGSLALFRWRAPAAAVLIVYLGGWLVLPVGNFPPGSAAVQFPYWITGLAVPSDMLMTKAWIAPAAALLGVLVFDRASLGRLRATFMDAPVLLWCAWPLLQPAAAPPASPAGWVASLYLAGCWGLPWLLGRLYFATADGRLLLTKGLAWAGVACLPFSLVEGALGPTLYGLVYDTHPFRFDGALRYIGYRPLGFFEDGNQFALWISLCALAAVWLALSASDPRESRTYRALAFLTVLMALAAQSLGAILMLGLGIAFLLACSAVRPRSMLAGATGLLILAGALYVSGAIPVLKFGKETALGRHVVDAFRSVGRGSFTWRIAQDQRLLPEAMARPLTGTAAWNWWRSKAMRPWGLTLLVLGQFGLIGLAACLGTLLAPAIAAAWRATRGSAWRPESLPLALAAIAVLTVLDGLMNSFIFFPAIVVAGALAVTPAAPRRRRDGLTNPAGSP